MRREAHRALRPKSTFSKFLASLLAAVLSVAGLVALGPAAYAATPGITTEVWDSNGNVLSDSDEPAVLDHGETLTLRVQYDTNVTPGVPIAVGIPDGLTVDSGSVAVPDGNTAIASIEIVGEEIHFVFNETDDWAPGHTSGVFGLDFTIDEVEHTGLQEVTWVIDGEPTTINLVVRVPGDEPGDVTNELSKSVTSGNLMGNEFVIVDRATDQVAFNGDVTRHDIQYTLLINSDADTPRENFTISDELSEYLVYDGNFTATITTWDESGWNQSSEEFEFSPSIDGKSFSETINVQGPSALTIRYSASVDPDREDDLLAELQAAYEASAHFPYGEFSVPLSNTATFGDVTDEAEVRIGTNVPRPPGPGVGQAFQKDVSPSQQRVEAGEDGALEVPAEFTYTISANLSEWDGRDVENQEEFILDRNVVITDNLPEPAQWATEDDEFFSITGTADGAEFIEATDFDGDAAAFADDQYVGQYAFVGKSLYVNVGDEPANNVTIDVKAFIDNVAEMSGNRGDYGFMYYGLRNTATFDYLVDGKPHTARADTELYDRGDTSEGVNIPGAFAKNAPDNGETVYIAPGNSATLDYSFVVNDGAPWDEDNIDVTQSYIVDYRDASIFDFSDVEGIQSAMTGSYGDTSLTGDDFELSLTDEENLRIELSEDRKAEFADSPYGRLQIDLPLETVVLEGRRTLNIENNATLYGQDDQPLYWSETTSDASSFGDEAEVRKTIRDTPHQEWTQNLRVELDEDGNMVQDEYVYNLAYIPHGSYTNLYITPVVDELPDEVEFLGFVTDDNVDTGEGAVQGPVDMGGNLEASYDEESHTVTVKNKDGQRLRQERNISANLLVRIVDAEENVPVVNAFGRSSATYTPSEAYPLSIEKVDTANDEAVIHDHDARFNILDENDNLVIEDAFVHNGFLSVRDDETGEVSGVVVEETGTYYVEEVEAPYGYFESDERVEVVVNENGSSQRVQFRNDPWPTYAIGDYVWIDSNRDGMQDDDEEPLEGVTVVLEDGNGNELDRTTTSESGRYVFDDLYEGDYRVRFILTDEQADIYAFTQYRAPEADVVNDSNAGSSGYSQRITLGPDNQNLVPAGDYEHADVTASEGLDPTWDAGVIIADFAVGDYVWIDENRDGMQDDDEEPLEGVTVVLYDGEGNELDRTTSDENGRYLFDNLPRGDYQVGFELTQEQQELYEFTGYTSGKDGRWDSDAGEHNRSRIFTLDEDNSQLVRDYQNQDVSAYHGIDPTWDAGVVRIEYAVGDYVWIDSNNDGVQDEDEEPLPGVTVVLYDGEGNELDRTVTDENGRYLFDNLTYGDYQVAFELTDEQAEQYNFTGYTTGDDVALDSDAGQANRSAVFRLDRANPSLISNADYEHGTVTASEGIDPTWDAGVVDKTYAIGDYVWIDENRDGIQDDDEEPLEGVTVVLYDGEGNELDRTVTDENGRYIFDNRPRGEYQIGFELDEEQAGLYEFTAHTEGEPEEDSNAGDQGRSEIFELGPDSPLTSDEDYEYFEVGASEGIDPTWDAGVVRIEYAVGDYVWIDENRDGIQDEDEEPLEGVTVVLYDGEGEELDRIVTEENGRYLFDNLTYGDYQVGFELTEDQQRLYNFTGYTTGEETAVDSDAGQDNRSAVFRLDRDNPSLISNADYEHGTVVASEGIDPTWDAGVVTKTYAIGDYVWIDSDADGQQGEDEEPLPGVTVELYEVDDEGNRSEEPVATTTTDENGRYLFDDLGQGNYQVRYILTEEQSRKYNFTEYTEGGSASDSDAGDDGYSEIISLNVDNESLDPEYQDQEFTATEGVDPTWDAGVTPKPYAIGDYVWIDENRDGIQDEGEPALDDVTVVLYDGEGNELERTVTDANGRYLFDYLDEGDYQVGFELTEEQQELYEFTDYNVADDPQVDSNAGENGRSAVFTLGPDTTLVTKEDYEHGTFGARLGIDPTWDAGVVRIEYAIGDYVWIDENHDGIQDEDEDPLVGVTVVLYDGEGNELDRTVTDENGRYLFDNLPRGEYQVGFELTEAQAAQYAFTKYTAGENTEVDSNAGEQARSAVFTLGPDNEFLVSNDEYDDGTVTASRGIDPTWDAGVVLLPERESPGDPTDPTGELGEPEDPTGPEAPGEPAGAEQDASDDSDGKLPLTGATLALFLTAAGLLLLVAGGALYARHRKGNEA